MRVLQILINILLNFSLIILGQDLKVDSRCFLESGGSTETFFVKESLKVGENIGSLQIIGDPGVSIDLRLRDNSSIVSLRSTSKDLILLSPFDKEALNGPSFLKLDVFCSRLQSPDPAFIIPLIFRVIDENDNAPLFNTATPLRANVSELTLLGTPIHETIYATDNDQSGPFSTIEYFVLPSIYSKYVRIENSLVCRLVLSQHLDYETLKVINIEIIAKDQGVPPLSSKIPFEIIVLDSDDQNPSFVHDRYETTLSFANSENENKDEIKNENSFLKTELLITPEPIEAFDQDLGLNASLYYSFQGQSKYHSYFELNRNTGALYLRSKVPQSYLKQSPWTLLLRATQFDNADRYGTTTLNVIYDQRPLFQSSSSSPLRFLQKTFEGQIFENAPLDTIIVYLAVNQPSNENLLYSLQTKDNEFFVDQRGNLRLRKSLEFEKRKYYNLSVFVQNEVSNDSANIQVRVLQSNDWDPRFKYSEYEFFVPSDKEVKGYVIGRLEVHDGDSEDEIHLSIRGIRGEGKDEKEDNKKNSIHAFSISSNGELSILKPSLLNGSIITLLVTAEDSGTPSRKAFVPVIIHLSRASHFFSLPDSLLPILGLIILFLLLIILLCLCILLFKISRKKYKQNPLKDSERSDELNKESFVHENTVYNPLNPKSKNRVFSTAVSPAPPPSSPDSFSLSETTLQASQQLQNLLKGSSSKDFSEKDLTFNWPKNSIPRRIKKLSWENEIQERDFTTLTDPKFSVMPYDSHSVH